jgi:hypothetical protein
LVILDQFLYTLNPLFNVITFDRLTYHCTEEFCSMQNSHYAVFLRDNPKDSP